MATQALSDEILDELGEEFSARVRQGESPSISEFISRFEGGQQDEVRDFLESIAMLEDLKTGNAGGPSQAEAIPEQFGRYRIEKSLGEGGMGAVYLAHDSQLDRKVALKTPKFSKNSDPNLISRFYREARSAATLQHPNICPVYDVGEIDGIHYISMAYIEGRPLSDCIRSKKFPPVNSVLRIVRKVALALHEAHQQGLVHRDLKPANIMISRRNEPIVMDFGLAKQFDSDDGEPTEAVPDGKPALSAIQNAEARLTLDGTVVGSPGYMSPEQLMGDHKLIGPASDVYALGVVLYELLTRELPFPGDGSLMSVVNSVMSDDPPDASVIRPKLEASVVAVCRKSMAKNADDRYPSMQAFAVALSEILKAENSSSSAEPVSEILDVPVSPELVRTKEQYELARSLYQEGQFAAAVSILEKMVSSGERDTNQFTRWARTELPKAKSKAEKAAASASAVGFPDDDFWGANIGEAAVATADYAVPSTRKSKKKSRRKKTSSLKKKIAVAAVCVLAVAVMVFAAKRFNKGRQSPGLADNSNTVASRSGSDTPIDPGAPDDAEETTASSSLPPETDSGQMDSTGSDSIDSRRPPKDDRPRGQRPPLRMVFIRLDQNQDGLLTLSELQESEHANSFMMDHVVENFDQFDVRPADNALNPAEFQQLMKLMAQKATGNRSFRQRPRPDRKEGNESGTR